ncbi:MAG: cobalt ECF transporter T component CbiQ [Acidobacteria bacterium]|nr:cobalt ECF transporter T component CbiQ [Acidobacteriota bacterium]
MARGDRRRLRAPGGARDRRRLGQSRRAFGRRRPFAAGQGHSGRLGDLRHHGSAALAQPVRRRRVVKYGFLDRTVVEDSPLARTDPRAKLLLTLAAVTAVASEPNGELGAYPYYFALLALLALAGRVGPLRLLRRCLPAAPFIGMAAALPLVSIWLDAGDAAAAQLFALSVLLRSGLAIALLTLLTETTAFADLLQAMRALRAPEALSAITTLMYRYIFVLFDEWRRVSQARACRTAGKLRLPALPFYGQQVGLAFVRSWERSERVHAAMNLRGFTGALPVAARLQLTAADVVPATLAALAFWAVRILL